eukprot:Pgem_evm1s14273
MVEFKLEELNLLQKPSPKIFPKVWVENKFIAAFSVALQSFITAAILYSLFLYIKLFNLYGLQLLISGTV